MNIEERLVRFITNERNAPIDCLIALLYFVRVVPKIGLAMSADLERVEFAIQRVCKRLHRHPLTHRQFNLSIRYLSQELNPREFVMAKKAKKTKVRKVKPIKRVKRVRLKKDEVLQVIAPPAHVPIIAPVVEEGMVELAPVPVERKRRWWEF